MCEHTKKGFHPDQPEGNNETPGAICACVSAPAHVAPCGFPCLQVHMPYSVCISACWQWNTRSALLLGAPGAWGCGSLTSTGLSDLATPYTNHGITE